MKYLVTLFESPRTPLLIVLLALLLASPSVITGYFGDDYLHHALLSPDTPFPKPQDGSLFGLFSFANAEPARNQLLRDYSLITWWTYDGLKYAFWRPVTEISHWLDHRLWRAYPAMMHIQNLFWYGLLCLVVFRAYRRFSTAALAATCALAVFALDSTHGFGIGWIANRNSLLAATFGFTALLYYAQWRETSLRRHQVYSLGFLALSLLSAEAGISTTAYLGAYALTLDRRGSWRGLLALAPHALLTVIWWLTYKYLGFGAANADTYYVDPTHSPALFALKLLERVPVLLASQFGLIPAEVYGFAGKSIPIYVVICGLFAAGVLALFWQSVRTHASSRFWLLGSLFALAPISTALPHDRNLLFVGVGASMLVGELFRQWYLARPLATGWARVYSGVIATFLAIHLIASPLLLPLMAYSPRIWSKQMGLDAVYLPDIDHLEQTSIVLLGAPLPASLGMIPIRYAEKLPLPAHLWTLTTLQNPLSITRTSADEVIVESVLGFVGGVEESLRNIESFPFTIGDRVQHSGMTIEVLSIGDTAKPTRIALRFVPDGLQKTVFLQWEKGHYVQVPLSDIGNSATVHWKPQGNVKAGARQ